MLTVVDTQDSIQGFDLCDFMGTYHHLLHFDHKMVRLSFLSKLDSQIINTVQDPLNIYIGYFIFIILVMLISISMSLLIDEVCLV